MKILAMSQGFMLALKKNLNSRVHHFACIWSCKARNCIFKQLIFMNACMWLKNIQMIGNWGIFLRLISNITFKKIINIVIEQKIWEKSMTIVISYITYNKNISRLLHYMKRAYVDLVLIVNHSPHLKFYTTLNAVQKTWLKLHLS